MADALSDAIAQAKAAAEAAAPATTAVATVSQNNTAVANAPSGPLTADQMMSGSFSVDAFIKVTEDGIKIGDSALIESMKVTVDLSEAFYYYAVKYGNPAVYVKSQNRVVATDGVTPWAKVMETARQVDGGKFKGDYRSADVPFQVVEPVVDMKGKTVAEPGDRIGKSLSTTEWKEWEQFLRSVDKKGLDKNSAHVAVEIGHKTKKNNNGNTWGVLTFTLLGEADEIFSDAA